MKREKKRKKKGRLRAKIPYPTSTGQINGGTLRIHIHVHPNFRKMNIEPRPPFKILPSVVITCEESAQASRNSCVIGGDGAS